MSKSMVVSFGSDSVWQLDEFPGVLYWSCSFAVDGDGHPECYHPQGSPPGLDYLANAGSQGNYWGIACNPDTTGKPYIQTQNDPAPGFYVSTTALIDASFPESNPNRYVHSGEVPFVVLPSKPKFHPNQTLGDLVACFNNATGKVSWAIYGDIGPSNEIGEGSIALAEALGINSNPKNGGTSEETIAMVYFPGSSLGWPKNSKELAIKTYFLFREWGGYFSAEEAMPFFNWHQFPRKPIPPSRPSPIQRTVTIGIKASPGVVVDIVDL